MSQTQKQLPIELPRFPNVPNWENDSIDLENFEPSDQFDEPQFETLAIGGARERVRFTGAVNVVVEGEKESFTGIILNLSSQGMACQLVTEFDPAERATLSFRLSLASELCDVRAEVVWCRLAANAKHAQEFVIGWRFIDVDENAFAALEKVVTERMEGRAGDWPLPTVPVPSMLKPEIPRMHPYIAAAGGMAVGILLTLLLSLIPQEDSFSSRVQKATSSPVQKEAVEEAARPAPSRPAMDESAPAAPAKTPAQATALPGVQAPEAVVEGTATGAHMTLRVDRPITEHVQFWLNDPHRLVVDIPGAHSAFPSKQYEFSHPLVTRMRVGEYGDKVRFVIETAASVAPEVKALSKENELYLEFKQQ